MTASTRSNPGFVVVRPKIKAEGPHKLKTLVRLLDMDQDEQERLKTCAEETMIPARSIVLAAIRAALDAIEGASYSVVMPMRFAARNVPERRSDLPPINPDLIDIEPGMRVRG